MSGIIEKSLNSDLAQFNSDLAKFAGIVGNQWRVIGIDKVEDAYINNSTVHRSINILAENGAKLPPRLYFHDEPLPDGYIIESKQYGAFNIKQPHPMMSLNELLYEVLVYKYYRGELMVYIDLEGRLTLEPVNPKLMKIKKPLDKMGNILMWKWNRKLDIPVEQLIYDSIFNPDGSRGVSLIEVIKEELINDAAAREYNTKFFKNFGKIGGILFDDKGEIQPSQMENLVKKFNQEHQGSDNAYETLGLPQGIKYQEFVQTMREMEFRGSRDDIRDRILSLFGIHKSVFGVTDKVDRAVADAAKRQLWTETLQPTMLGIQEKFNNILFNRYFPGYRMEFDFSVISVLQEDETEKVKRGRELHKVGYTINEINETLRLNMPEIDDIVGDMRFVSQEVIPMDEYIAAEEPKPKKTVNDDKIDKIVEVLDKKEEKARRNTAYRRKYNRVKRSIEKKMNNKLGKYFATQLGKVLAIVKEGKSITKTNSTVLLSEIMNLLNREKDEIIAIMKPLYEDGSLTASKLALDALGVKTKPSVNSFVTEQMGRRISGINNRTYKLIRKQIREAVAGGETIDQMTKRVQRVYKFNKSRARTIARTESGMLMNRTTNEEYRKEGVEKKQWVGGQRPTHAAIDGQVKTMGEAFGNGLMYPGDSAGPPGEVINCRCCLAPVVE